ncbi:hypothetical protein WISP_69149 [Willisornis vidua]|uniref:Uncharacterized protein n=1 Tax=Willisornis vidua TaxID=1566151 RepID=A0ABQ9D8R3_9PASS|nr:hypothetical protein WISP_69149 [Willisornis vidua]
MLMRTQLRWAGHISRMEGHPLPKIVLYGELTTSCRKRGAPKRRYKDSLKQHLSLGHVVCHQWSTLAPNRDSWVRAIYDVAASFENALRVNLEEQSNVERTVPRQYHLQRLSTVPFVTRFAYAALAFLATSMLAASMGSAIPRSLFMKSSHDDDDDD